MALIKRKTPYKRAFKVSYFYWGEPRFPAARGFTDDLAEAYGLASRHLGRGSIYWRAIIEDTSSEQPIARLTRYMGQIKIEEF